MNTPESIYKLLIADLKANADEKRQASEHRYFKETIRNIGIPIPKNRIIFKKYLPAVQELDSANTLLFAAKLYHSQIYEAEHLGTETIAKTIKNHKLTDVYNVVMQALGDGVMDNWAIIDLTSSHVMHHCVEDLQLQHELFKLTEHGNIWHRRISIVSYVMHAKYGNYHDQIYKTAETLISDKEDLMHKAVGWVLRQTWYSDTPRLVAFISDYGKKMNRTTLRYAIEKFSPDERKEFLLKTKN